MENNPLRFSSYLLEVCSLLLRFTIRVFEILLFFMSAFRIKSCSMFVSTNTTCFLRVDSRFYSTYLQVLINILHLGTFLGDILRLILVNNKNVRGLSIMIIVFIRYLFQHLACKWFRYFGSCNSIFYEYVFLAIFSKMFLKTFEFTFDWIEVNFSFIEEISRGGLGIRRI